MSLGHILQAVIGAVILFIYMFFGHMYWNCSAKLIEMFGWWAAPLIGAAFLLVGYKHMESEYMKPAPPTGKDVTNE